MSTTTEQSVAMGYASGQRSAGIVIEVQQGMVDRGADISWLSQYPHEREILCAHAVAPRMPLMIATSANRHVLWPRLAVCPLSLSSRPALAAPSRVLASALP